VHRAEHIAERRTVALKRLLPHLRGHTELATAFAREGELARHMRHPNVAQTYEVGAVAGVPFLAIELVPGPTLDQIMRHSQAVAGAIPIPVALALLVQICDALDYAHNLTDRDGRVLGIVHRDVSPPNVIVSNTGVVKLVDFGIAKIQNTSAMGNFNVTGKNVIKGKMGYVAPEYLQGMLDTRADIFAVGVIAHELLTGRRLFEGADDFETTARVLEMPIQPPSRWALGVPKDLDTIVLTALARDPEQRWQAASAMRTALGQCGIAIASEAALLEWVTWAFRQKSRPSDAQIGDVLSMFEPASSAAASPPAQQWSDDATRLGIPPPVPASGATPRLTESGANRPLIVSAKPLALPQRGRPLDAATPVSGAPVVVDAPRTRWMWLVLLVALAAVGGVAATLYVLDRV
jgi:serine/threonine protein kinase